MWHNAIIFYCIITLHCQATTLQLTDGTYQLDENNISILGSLYKKTLDQVITLPFSCQEFYTYLTCCTSPHKPSIEQLAQALPLAHFLQESTILNDLVDTCAEDLLHKLTYAYETTLWLTLTHDISNQLAQNVFTKNPLLELVCVHTWLPEPIQFIHVHTNSLYNTIVTMHTTPNHKFVILIGKESGVYIINTHTKKLNEIKLNNESMNYPYNISFNNDGLALQTNTHIFCFFFSKPTKPYIKISTQANKIPTCIAYHNSMILAGFYEGHVVKKNLYGLQSTRCIARHNNPVLAIMWSQDKQYSASCAADNAIIFTKIGKPLAKFKFNNNQMAYPNIKKIALNANATYIALWSDHGHLFIKQANGKNGPTVNQNHVIAAQFSNKENYMGLLCSNSPHAHYHEIIKLCLIDLITSKEQSLLAPLHAHTIQFNQQSTLIAASSYTCIHVYSTNPFLFLVSLPEQGPVLNYASFDAYGTSILYLQNNSLYSCEIIDCEKKKNFLIPHLIAYMRYKKKMHISSELLNYCKNTLPELYIQITAPD